MRKYLILKVFLTILLGAMGVLAVSAEEASAPATPGTNASASNNASSHFFLCERKRTDFHNNSYLID
jgi:hypothetical protein